VFVGLLLLVDDFDLLAVAVLDIGDDVLVLAEHLLELPMLNQLLLHLIVLCSQLLNYGYQALDGRD
jgi:hypothetical protein